MANSMLTMQNIARNALPILEEMLAFPNLINKDYSNDFVKKGDTIQVKRPAVYVADEFGTTVNLQDVNPHPIYVKMDTIADVSVEISSADMALEMDDFVEDVIKPAVTAIAEKINQDGLAQYKFVNSFTGTAGTTPDGLDDIANARGNLNNNKAPLPGRNAVWDADADVKLSIVDAIVNAEKSGSTETLREGSIGKIQGINNYMSQAIKTHTAGLYTALADVTGTVDVSAVNTTDTTTGYKITPVILTSAAGTSTATLLAGDILTIAGNQYFVLEDTAAAIAGVVTAKLYPQLSADLAAVAVTFADVTAGGHVANLAFHPKAFAFVSRPLEAPKGGVESYSTNYNGLTIRVTMGYNMSTKKEQMSFDVLYGYATPYPELATRILG